MKVVVQLVGMFIHLEKERICFKDKRSKVKYFWEVSHPMLVVEELQPVCPVAGDCIGKSLCHLIEDFIVGRPNFVDPPGNRHPETKAREG